MGVSLTSAVDLATMSSADFRSNLTALSTFTNGGSAITDYTSSSFDTKAFKRFDHYQGSIVRSSIGTTGGVWELSYDTSRHHRVALHPSAHNMSGWQDIGAFAIRFKVPYAANIDAEISYWAWSIQADAYAISGGVPTAEFTNQCDFAPFLDGTVQAECQRTLFDSGSDTGVNQGGQFLYPARNFNVSVRGSVTAGRHAVRMKVNFRNTVVAAEQPLVWLGARSIHLVAEWR